MIRSFIEIPFWTAFSLICLWRSESKNTMNFFSIFTPYLRFIIIIGIIINMSRENMCFLEKSFSILQLPCKLHKVLLRLQHLPYFLRYLSHLLLLHHLWCTLLSLFNRNLGGLGSVVLEIFVLNCYAVIFDDTYIYIVCLRTFVQKNLTQVLFWL